MSSAIQEAKRKLPLPALMHRLGLGEHAKKSAKCPFHDDQHNSFSIWCNDAGQWFWKCHAGCGEGDEITFLEFHDKIPRPDAIRRYLALAGIGFKPPQEKFDWASCVDAMSDHALEKLAKWRGFSYEFCIELKKHKLIGVYRGLFATPVFENGTVIGTHYRLKEEASWRYYPVGIKAQPLVIGKLTASDPVDAFESTWDGFAYMEKSGYREGIIISRGKSNAKLAATLLPKGSIARLWTQNDAPGSEWEREFCANTAQICKRVKIPQQHKDLNEWIHAGACVNDLIEAIARAETLREAEKTWVETIRESVVTTSELSKLEIPPRQRLLGDWFCEGDLGFIFGPRGVGKTWLSLAIACALSGGLTLGDWKGHRPVKVLYLDGEMPPDLMQTRCNGLGAANANFCILNHEILFNRTSRVLNITKPEIQQGITESCISDKIKVLFLDNLSTLASGMRENEADDWEKVGNWLLQLRREKIAVVINHHAGRSGEMRGTSKREDAVFWILRLDDSRDREHDKRGACFTTRFTKSSRNIQEDIPAFQWHFVTEQDGQVSIACNPASSLDVFRKIIEDGVTECGQIAKEMGLSPATVSRLAKKAFLEGWLKKEGREYVIIEAKKKEET